MKCGLFSRGHLLQTLFLGAALACPAVGAPITVYFDGTVVAGEHRGLEAPPGGVPVLSVPIFQTTGAISVANQSANGSSITVPSGTPPPNQVTSQWVVQKDFTGSFGNPAYLLFAQLENHPTLATSYDVDFTDEPDSQANDHAGLVIDPALGWRTFQTVVDIGGVPTTFYYVGAPLGNFSNVGQNCGGTILVANQSCVSVTYFLESPEDNLFPNGANQILGLPQTQILFAVVPEPATAMLVAAGLIGLAAARRRRHS